MSPSPLVLEEVVKEFGPFKAVDKVSFEIEPGEIFGLLGPNGAGKTTIISMITTLLSPTSGSIRVMGADVINNPLQAKREIGCVPQELIHHGYFTVFEVVKFYSSYFGLWNNNAHIVSLLKRLDLWIHKDKSVKMLSGGMKRRLLIAKALVHNPKLLLLDEPTAGVDIELKESLWELVEELRNAGTSILLTTHYLEEAEKLCDRVAILSHGKMIRVDDLTKLMGDFSKRLLTLKLKEPSTPVTHKYLKLQEDRAIIFEIPHSFPIGKLLQEVSVDSNLIADIHIREGKLEDVFKDLLHSSN